MTTDRGSASIYAAAVGVVIVLLGLAAAVESRRIVAAAQARTAADLGALAGAARLAEGEEAACAYAATIVAANAAALTACRADGMDLLLTVDVSGRQATARGGPIRSEG